MRDGVVFRWLKIVFLWKNTIPLLFSYLYDWQYYIKHSFYVVRYNTKNKEKAMLMLRYHSLEKGLSFSNQKKNFGLDKALNLLKISKKYLEKYGLDKELLTALSVLGVYYNITCSWGTENEKIRIFHEKWSAFDQELRGKITKQETGGTKNIVLQDSLISCSDFKDFAATRYSVRSFDQSRIIDNDLIERALDIAQTAPSVCNRQTSRVHIYNYEDCAEIIENQLGDQGWTFEANQMFVITSDVSFFGSVAERKQPFIDGGMFSMLFILGLHAQNIATCCKMYVREPKIEKDFYKLTKIAECEVPIMLILAGHHKDNSVKVPCSNRLDRKMISTYH